MKHTNEKIVELIKNKKAYHDYTIEDKFEAGMALEGWEVKAIRQHKITLLDSHVIIRHQECYLIGAHITPLDTAAIHTHPDPTRTRKLLLKKKEIAKLTGAVQQKGYTIIPCALYLKGRLIKLRIALAKGKNTMTNAKPRKKKTGNDKNRSS